MLKETSCFFTGHRIIPQAEIDFLKRRLKEETSLLIRNGIFHYFTAGALGFDALAALQVLQLKELDPRIKLTLVLPCLEQSKCWKDDDVQIYCSILQKADDVLLTSEHYYRGCMHKRNRQLADSSQYCICYCRKNTGGTAYTVQYAKAKGVHMIYL